MPHFTSPGANAGKAIEDFFVQQALKQRQDMIDAQRQKAQEDEVRQRDAQLTLQQQQEARIGAAQTQQQGDLETEREFRRASTIHTNALPGILDPATADLLKRQGFGDIVSQGQPTQGAPQFDPTQVNDVPQYDVVPGLLETKGGTAYQQSRLAEQARAEQATQAQAAAAERASADREAASERARIAAGAHADTTGLRNDLLRTQITAANQKQEEATKAAQAGESAITEHKNRIKQLVSKLYDPQSGQLTSNASRVFGPVSGVIPNMTGDANTALADVDALISTLDVNTLQQLKRQSKTGASGFGALSEKELQVLESAGTTLRNKRQSESSVAAELKRLLETVSEASTVAPGGKVTIKSITQIH